MDKVWKVDAIVPETARTYTFDVKDRVSKDVIKTLTIEQYYLEKYNVRLQEPHLPLVKSKRDVYFPMELCYLIKGQRYPYKLSDTQVLLLTSSINHIF